jgi:hypothetical protein
MCELNQFDLQKWHNSASTYLFLHPSTTLPTCLWWLIDWWLRSDGLRTKRWRLVAMDFLCQLCCWCQGMEGRVGQCCWWQIRPHTAPHKYRDRPRDSASLGGSPVYQRYQKSLGRWGRSAKASFFGLNFCLALLRRALNRHYWDNIWHYLSSVSIISA